MLLKICDSIAVNLNHVVSVSKHFEKPIFLVNTGRDTFSIECDSEADLDDKYKKLCTLMGVVAL